MSQSLSLPEVEALIRRIFAPGPEDRIIGVLTDLPDSRLPDSREWSDRREIAAEWTRQLASLQDRLGMETRFYLYPNVHSNNADLPQFAWRHTGPDLPCSASQLAAQDRVPFEEVFAACRIILAPVELSATAPLRIAARRHGFRAASMPGFSRRMMASLKLDYEEIDRRCRLLKELLDQAQEARIRFQVEGIGTRRLSLDLRHRLGHVSGGLLRQPGTAANLPSGESFIVPYEGEIEGDPSRSQGSLPVQFGDEVVLYRIEANRAVEVEGSGQAARREARKIASEPAYANLAELGLGVLGAMGIQPSGYLLLDEKLGLHIAFGRSDHFGGQVGPGDFSSADSVEHIDRIYLPELQSKVRVSSARVIDSKSESVTLIRDDRFVYEFS